MVAETKMTITKKDLQKYSSEIASLLKNKNISSLGKLEKKWGNLFLRQKGSYN